MLLLGDEEEQALTQLRNTKTCFHICAAKCQEDNEKLTDKKESRVKCQGQLAKLDFSNAGLVIEHANDTKTYNATQNYETVVNEWKARNDDEDISSVMKDYKKCQMLGKYLSNSEASRNPDFPDNNFNVYKRKVLGKDESQDKYMQSFRKVLWIDEKIPSDESFSPYNSFECEILELTSPSSKKRKLSEKLDRCASPAIKSARKRRIDEDDASLDVYSEVEATHPL